MMKLLMFFDQLIKGVDIAFFIICAAIIALGVAIYFLIPVFNKKQYQEQRDNLRKREEAFKSNMAHAEESAEEATTAQEQKDGDVK